MGQREFASASVTAARSAKADALCPTVTAYRWVSPDFRYWDLAAPQPTLTNGLLENARQHMQFFEPLGLRFQDRSRFHIPLIRRSLHALE